jgi:uncharacterized membrane protein YccC
MIVQSRLSPWKLVYSLNMGIVCAISYWAMTYALASVVGMDSDPLGGMWSAVATLFVYRSSRNDSLSAGASRLVATCVSFALCLPYLWVFPFAIPGLAALIGVGTLAMMLLGRQDDIVTTGTTTTVVMVVAAIGPTAAWQQPVLRLADTVVGIGIGVAGKWITSYLYFGIVGTRPR